MIQRSVGLEAEVALPEARSLFQVFCGDNHVVEFLHFQGSGTSVKWLKWRIVLAKKRIEPGCRAAAYKSAAVTAQAVVSSGFKDAAGGWVGYLRSARTQGSHRVVDIGRFEGDEEQPLAARIQRAAEESAGLVVGVR